MGFDEPFSATTSVQRRKCASHSRPHDEEICRFPGRPRWRKFLPRHDVVRIPTEYLTAHNIYCRPPEDTALFLHDGKGFHDENLRSRATGETGSSQPTVATSRVWTKGRVSGTRERPTLDTSNCVLFYEGRAAAGIHASSPEGNGPGLCTIILAGGRSGGHQAAVMCAVRHLDIWVVLRLLTSWYARLSILPCL